MGAVYTLITIFILFFGLILFILFIRMFRVLNEYERGLIFRLGKFSQIKGPGLIILLPILDKMVKISLRTLAIDVPSQDIITRDNVSVKVNAVVFPPYPAGPIPVELIFSKSSSSKA